MNKIEDMVNSLVQGDKEAAADMFNAIFSEKAATALNQYSQEIGKTFFDGQTNESTLDEVNLATMDKLTRAVVTKYPVQGKTGDNPGKYPAEGIAKLNRIQKMTSKVLDRPSVMKKSAADQAKKIVDDGKKYQGRY